MSNDFSQFFGWNEDPRSVEEIMKELPFPIYGDISASLKGSGKGKIALIYKYIILAAKIFPLRKQTIGDCVSHGTAYAVDGVKAVDIVLKKDFEEWVAETATEDIYAGSRIVIGKGKLGSGDGSIGAWAARYVNEYGALPRGKYGSIDLSKYDGGRAKAWGMPSKGVPSDVLEKAKQHPILTVSQVRTYEEVRDLIANGYTVAVCSSQGFSSKRDNEGFARPEGSWAHCMSVLAVDDEYKRPGVLIQNSWGVWNSGPKRHDQPDGSFWCDADVLEKRILSKNDSWAFSGYEGFKPKELNTRIF